MQLSACYLFQGLTESQLSQIRTIGSEAPIEAGQWLFREGDPAELMYVLKEGAVELLTTVDEVELPITIVKKPGNCFGTSMLVPPHQYSLSARCAEDGMLLSIHKADLERLINADVKLGHVILANLAKHFLDRLKETRQELKIHFKTIFKSMHH
ncbi:MAG: cyclic nucleotide-binding domain-containing protein [Deltaproteobacteria bacterium]|jgi:CRP-like cAMP-binding protein|nr:cyclic nucleotide-binding domain-containing protein [Deltaproteobacteria bacterium]